MFSIFPGVLIIIFLTLLSISLLSIHTLNIDGTSYGAVTIVNALSSDQNDTMISYNNPKYGISIQYPSDWNLSERTGNGYHMLNVVAEFLQPAQNSYYKPNISATHNSFRLSIQNYTSFEGTKDNNSMRNTLQNIGNARMGSIGISCPGFDLKSYSRNATLSGLPAYQIEFNYAYLDNNKKATEIWTIKDDEVYIVDYVANEKEYDVTFPIVKVMIQSFKIAA
jgi:eukaryotic-like serine/threonine-protein kinase